MTSAIMDPRTYEIIGAAFDVHREVGAGTYTEGVCRDALAVEFDLRGIPYRTEVPFPILYKGHRLPSLYRADFVCFATVVVEIKSISTRTGRLEDAQMLKYLRAANLTVGLLLNFGLPSLEHRRWVMGDFEAEILKARELYAEKKLLLPPRRQPARAQDVVSVEVDGASDEIGERRSADGARGEVK
jgi:GxxExxY protein